MCAISPSWTFDRQARRWRRLDSAAEAPPPDVSPCDGHDVCSINSSSGSEGEGQNLRETTSTATSATATTSTTDEHETSGSSSRCSSTHRTPSTGASLSGPPSPARAGGWEAEGRFLEKPPRKKGSGLLKKMERLWLRESTGLINSRTAARQAPSRPRQQQGVGSPSR